MPGQKHSAPGQGYSVQGHIEKMPDNPLFKKWDELAREHTANASSCQGLQHMDERLAADEFTSFHFILMQYNSEC
jgi:hypothetical protein